MTVPSAKVGVHPRPRHKHSLGRTSAKVIATTIAVTAALLVPGVLFAVPWFETPTDNSGLPGPQIGVLIQGTKGSNKDTELHLNRSVSLSNEGAEAEQVSLDFGDEAMGEIESVRIYFKGLQWDATNTCHPEFVKKTAPGSFSVNEGPGVRMVKTRSAELAPLVVSAMDGGLLLNQYDKGVGGGATQFEGISVGGGGWSQALSFRAEPSASKGSFSAVVCNIDGLLVQDGAQGQRFVRPLEVDAAFVDSRALTVTDTSRTSYPGTWIPGNARNAVDFPTDSISEPADNYARFGSAISSVPVRSVGVAWSSQLFVDTTKLQTTNQLAWVGAILIGAWLGVVIPIIVNAVGEAREPH